MKNQVLPNHQTTQALGKAGTLPSNEGESGQVLEIRVDPSHKSMGGIGTAFFDLRVDAEKIGFGLVGQDDPHSRNYLRPAVRA
jgi:hypothetical protein